MLGRYGAHALAIAVLVPAVWMSLGLVNGNLRGNVFSDGNGFFFFAFVLVVVTLVREGDGAWFLRLFFAACATSAILYFLLIVVTASGAVSLDTVREWLSVRLGMGGVIGHMPNGAYRLFTGGSLFLVVGAALTTRCLLARPRVVWLWLLGGLFFVDLIATYTRGLWLAALVSVALVLALDVRGVRQLGLAVGIPTVLVGLALVVAPATGFSLYGYVTNRAVTIGTTSHTKYPTRVENPGFESVSPRVGRDRGGWAFAACAADDVVCVDRSTQPGHLEFDGGRGCLRLPEPRGETAYEVLGERLGRRSSAPSARRRRTRAVRVGRTGQGAVHGAADE